MLKKMILIIMLGLFFFSFARAEEFISPQEAKQVAQGLMERNLSYCAVHQEKPGCIPGWVEAKPGNPVLVYAYSDLKPCYYLVPVVDQQNRIISIIGTSAITMEWQWFSQVQLDRFPKVSKDQAYQVCQTRLYNAKLAEPKIVEMPNKKLYWLFLTEGSDPKEIFVNIDDASEIHTSSDPDFSDFTALSQPLMPRNSNQESAKGIQPQVSLRYYPPSYDIVVPFYYQETSWYCGEAALKMVFDYWGDSISQTDIGDVANESISYGTYSDDLRRASHFSYLSTAIQNPLLTGYNERNLGYSGSEVYWSDEGNYPDRYNDLKNLVSNDYPVLILTWYSSSHASGHFRVVKGYNDNLNHFIVHDPWYSAPYYGPNVHFNQTFLVDNLWEYSSRWGLLSAPWKANITAPPMVYPGEQFTLDAIFLYTAPHPFENQFLADSTSATVYLPSGYQLVSPLSATIYFGSQYSGFTGYPSWQIQAPSDSTGLDSIRMEVKGKVNGSSYSYSEYQDWIGGQGKAMVKTVLFIRGDLNRDHVKEVGDVVYLINYLFKGGTPPLYLESGDVNCDGIAEVGDVVYLINYLFKSGIAPCE